MVANVAEEEPSRSGPEDVWLLQPVEVRQGVQEQGLQQGGGPDSCLEACHGGETPAVDRLPDVLHVQYPAESELGEECRTGRQDEEEVPGSAGPHEVCGIIVRGTGERQQVLPS